MEVENLLHKIRDRAVRLNKNINTSIRERKKSDRARELNLIDLRVYSDEYDQYYEEAYEALHGVYRNLLKYIPSRDKKYARRIYAGYTKAAKIREREQRFTRDAWHPQQNIPPDILKMNQMRFDVDMMKWNESIGNTLGADVDFEEHMVTVRDPDPTITNIAERWLGFQLQVAQDIASRMEMEEAAMEEKEYVDAQVKEFIETSQIFMAQATRAGEELYELTYGYYQLRHIDMLYRILELYEELDRMWSGFITFDREFEDKVSPRTRQLFRTSMYGFFRTLNKMTMDLLTKLRLR